ncbi:MAG: hypothetical protein Q7T26_05260 [Dehalococcoidia bacterium]|nr:hypothetical protein [Dehalococcoidia bacterium]
MARNKVLIGVTGVHYVAFQLSARGLKVRLTPPGARLMVANPGTGKTIDVQVKTNPNAYVKSKKEGPYFSWRISEKLAKAQPREGYFFVLVDLRGGPPTEETRSYEPDVYIVPSEELEKTDWKSGRNNFWCWVDESDASEYRNRWDRIQKALT